MYEVHFTNKNGHESMRSFCILDDAFLFVNYCFFRFLCVSSITLDKKVFLPYLDSREKRDFFFSLLRSKEITLSDKTYRIFRGGIEIEYPMSKIIRFPTLHDFFSYKFTSVYHSRVYLYNKVISEEVKRDTYYDRDGNLAHETVETKRVEKSVSKKKIQEKESSKFA